MNFKLASWEIESDENSKCLTVFHTNGKLINCLSMPYLSVFFVSQEKLNLIEFNQQIGLQQISNF